MNGRPRSFKAIATLIKANPDAGMVATEFHVERTADATSAHQAAVDIANMLFIPGQYEIIVKRSGKSVRFSFERSLPVEDE